MLVVVTRLQAKDVRSTAEVGRRTGEALEPALSPVPRRAAAY